MRITTTICAAAIALCGMLNAQQATTVDQVKVHFSTPVEAGDATVPAGDCSIQVFRGATGNLILALHSESGSSVALMATRLNKPDNYSETGSAPQVILSRHGAGYRLERILMADHSGFEVMGSVE